jgi:predicted NUDIX family phosphoesterase
MHENTKEKEKVLVFPASVLEKLPPFDKFTTKTSRYIDEILDEKNLLFIDREQAENEPQYKQLIPYQIIYNPSQDEVFTYVRGENGRESRIHKMRSLGVGGHVNETDLIDGKSLVVAYHVGKHRELDEELYFAPSIIDVSYISGIIYDDSTNVGKVHFGIVHTIQIRRSSGVKSKEDSLADAKFMSVREVKKSVGEFETWSQLVIANLL